jgi:Sec-independent protein translocase protein TatA
MNIFGIGGAELVLILIIMLVVAGPKRMIQWAYVLGRYAARLQQMWREAAAVLQKEFDAAGVEVEVPKNLPTRDELRKTVARAITPVTSPLEDAAKGVEREIRQDIDNVRLSTQVPSLKKQTATGTSKSAPSTNGTSPDNTEKDPGADFGTWSGGQQGGV